MTLEYIPFRLHPSLAILCQTAKWQSSQEKHKLANSPTAFFSIYIDFSHSPRSPPHSLSSLQSISTHSTPTKPRFASKRPLSKSVQDVIKPSLLTRESTGASACRWRRRIRVRRSQRRSAADSTSRYPGTNWIKRQHLKVKAQSWTVASAD